MRAAAGHLRGGRVGCARVPRSRLDADLRRQRVLSAFLSFDLDSAIMVIFFW